METLQKNLIAFLLNPYQNVILEILVPRVPLDGPASRGSDPRIPIFPPLVFYLVGGSGVEPPTPNDF